MAQTGSDVSRFQSDIQKLLLEARHRWLRPAEICEILRNHQKFHIDSEPPDKPPSGSIFLFDRKVLRYFRKDGHNWRKKKDGKTVREAHEKLKVGSVDMLHCYYAHGEGNETFQRRSYWMLEQDFMHIVFVHYLEVKGNKANISGVIDTQKVVTNSQDDSPLSFSCPSKLSNTTSAYTDSTSPTSTLTSACEDAESEDNHQASSRFHSFLEGPLVNDMDKIDTDLYSSYYLHPCSDFFLEQGQGILDQLLQGEDVNKQEPWRSLPVQASWQFPFEDRSLDLHKEPLNQNLSFDSNAETGYIMESNSENDMTTVGTGNYPFIVKQPLLDGSKKEEGLKKVDSFSRWIAKELGEVEELHMQSTNGIPWSFIESVDAADDSTIPTQLQLDADSLDPSISQDQLFSIIDFSPNWAYSNLATKVLITGTFLKSEQEVAKCKWSCMFGEVEVPAEVLADGVLCCHAPPHSAGQVPFYVTCSNRLACSEVREFEFRVGSTRDIDFTESNTTEKSEMILRRMRLERLLSLGSVGTSNCFHGSVEERENMVSKIIALMEEEENYSMEKLMPEDDFLQPRLLKEKLFSWLLYKVTEDGKGPSVMDEEGQGVLHLAAALGYNWALRPTIDSGVSIDFRDVNGWTALHWAAFCGREETVAALVSLSAAPGALTDPSPEFPLGRTPADLASGNGHKGISGFLAESSLTKYLSSLAMNDPNENSVSENCGVNTVQTVTERSATPITDGDVADVLSLKDSLAAVCNATHAACRIHQIFRMQSFERKQFIERENDEFGSLSLVAAKTSRLGKNDGTHTAAICIQKKFRGWKKRKEFLIIRQRIVRIQAHVRGHQVRKKYNRGITWSVGILEKVILRWRRKGSGLRGFRPDDVVKSPNSQEDDYDFLKEGRKQNEQRLQKALARVKSMAQNPEARAQYRRLLTVTEGFRETNTDACSMVLNSSENTIPYGEDDLIDVETLLDDDSFMSIAFE